MPTGVTLYMIKIFMGGGGGAGVVDGQGAAVKDAIKGLSKNILKQGWVKVKVVLRGRGFLKVSPPLPPENCNCI